MFKINYIRLLRANAIDSSYTSHQGHNEVIQHITSYGSEESLSSDVAGSIQEWLLGL